MVGSAVAPVRYPVALGDCLRAVFGRGQEPVGHLVASGQEALEVALRGVKELHAGDRHEVVVPDFICPTVPAAVRDAGLVPRVCELDAKTWFYRPEALAEAIGPSTCAVVPVAYFGFRPTLATELDSILNGAPIIEDLAQSYGVTTLDAPWGTPAFRIFSFGRGKSLPLGWGGLVVAGGKDERRWLETVGRQRPPGSVVESLFNLTLSQIQSLVLHPMVWRLLPVPERLPSTEPGKRQHGDPRWPVTRYVGSCRSLAPQIAVRRRNSRRLARELRDCPGLDLPKLDERALSCAVALRFPVVFEQVANAEEVRRRLTREKIIKGPNDFDDYGESSANARDISRRLVTLPTYRGSESAQAAAVKVIHQVMER